MVPVKIYTTDSCGFCRAAENLLEAKKIAFENVRLKDREEMDAVIEETGWFTFPQVIIGNEMIGGFQELRALDQTGVLDDKLKG